MKTLLAFAMAATLIQAGPLQDVKNVYVFPMRNAMDQYLVNQLSHEHIFQVVSDPKAADAFFTDHVDADFETAFNKMVLDAKAPAEPQRPQSSMSRGHGVVFLVNKRKQVIWSAFEPAKDSSARQVERAVRRSVDRLKKDLQPSAPPALTTAS